MNGAAGGEWAFFGDKPGLTIIRPLIVYTAVDASGNPPGLGKLSPGVLCTGLAYTDNQSAMRCILGPLPHGSVRDQN